MPEVFGRYQLLRKLATGGMAQIFLARQSGMEGFEKLLVIKRILPHLAGNEEFIKMFLDEARIAARLNHPNVVQIFDLGQIEQHFFIAMEYLHGEDARRVWKQSDRVHKPLPAQLCCRIVMDACAGLDFAHKKTTDQGEPLGIVHRDVSPQNIIVTFAGGVKVVDFGIAKAVDQSSVTRSGVVKGKYSYMSPEQAGGAKVDARTDQFALGIVLYELLTGQRLFKRASDLETLRAVEACAMPPPSEVSPHVPASLDSVVMRALNKDAGRRYPDCLAFQLALEEWLVQNRLASSSAQLQAFLADIYSEQLAQEKVLGNLLWEGDSGPFSIPSGASDSGVSREREPSSRSPASGSNSKSKAGSGAHSAPGRVGSSGGTGPKPTVEVRPPHTLAGSAPPKPRPFQAEAQDEQGKTVSEISRGTSSTQASSVRQNPRSSLAVIAGASAVLGLGGLALVAIHALHSDPIPTPVETPRPAEVGGVATIRSPESKPEVQLSNTTATPAPRIDPPRDVEHTPAHVSHATSGVLDLDGAPSLQVVLDGRSLRLPFHDSLSVGRHKLVVTDPALDLHDPEEIDIHPGDNHRSLRYGSGKVQVLVHPTESYAEVYLSGAKVGVTPMQPFELAEGEHLLVLKNPDLGAEQRKTVRVNAGQVARIDVTWDPQ